MEKEIFIIKKSEAFSFDELNLILEIIDSVSCQAISKIDSLKKSLENEKENFAIFFMPKSSFDIFSMFQGDNSICQIDENEIQNIVTSFQSKKSAIPENIFSHINEKLVELNDFVKNGNQVKPVLIKWDCFEKIH